MVNPQTTGSTFLFAIALLTSITVLPSIAFSADTAVNVRLIADSQTASAQTAKSQSASAENASTKSAKTKPSDRTNRLDPQLEQRANELVQSHLPTLSKLLQRLKSDNPRQYELAIRDLAKSVRRLDLAKKRDQVLYDIELELLKAQSSVKIHTAKLKVRDNQADRTALRASAKRLLKAEVSRAEYNVNLMTERAKRAKQQLAAAHGRLDSLQKNSDSQLDRKYTLLLRSAGRKADASEEKAARSNSKRRKTTPPKD
ncbi:hypothetical protein [Planctomycetes bacterium K23_9]|uniref:Uncharacterized protein n=1 Tax=Stieleria marina TaxID=1930275 RepID=A0A517NNR2_9BACT|nr:hypothetical protein K239x_06960 [Planctomycetes bacterium K23_9]